MAKPRVLILGAGPAGVGAAYQLRRLDRADVTVLEQRDTVGGNAGSFEMDGQRLDYGSHRLHPASDPAILDDIRMLLNGDLVRRPRHGRILLEGSWIHFPLKPLDLILHGDLRFALGAARDGISRPLRRGRDSHKKQAGAASNESFASVLRDGLGPTICDSFYFPYARKIWGREPEMLSPIQARRRVSASSISRLLRKVIAQVPGVRKGDTGYFYYPRRGYGQISEAYAAAAREMGASIMLASRVSGLERALADDTGWKVTATSGQQERVFEADYVWSTLPISLLAGLINPAPPAEVTEAARSLEYRSMLLIYIQLPVEIFTEYDAHYFPDTALSITRLSEPKNYAATGHPRGLTTLCAELPSSPGEAPWSMDDSELADLVAGDLKHAGIPLPCSPSAVQVKRLRHAYPIYTMDYERHFRTLDIWGEKLPRLLTYGRQGLFAHDNTHHALFMAYAAADCLTDGAFDEARWRSYRSVFETHVVED